jgi:hypothetical protein
MTTFDPRTVRPTYSGQFPGQQFPGPVPPPPSRPKSKRPLAAKIVAGLVAAGLVVGGAGTWMAFSGSTAEAAVQSTSFAGANPTTNPFGTDAPQVAAVAATGPQTGDTKGLYAATDPASCNNADFLSQLQADPAKLAGFGGVFGLGAGDVPAFVNSLSPVVLRANTSVTDHPFQDGKFVEQPAILAAGTAVLVNSYGEPTVKCFNGNPLTGGAPLATAVSVIPTDQVISTFQFTSVDNSRVVVVPGKDDPKPNKGHNPDPFLEAKADAAKQLADNARKEATTARDEATKAVGAQKEAENKLIAANNALAAAGAALNSTNPILDPIGFARAKQAFELAAQAQAQAASDFTKAKQSATEADKKAKDLEDKATADEQAAEKAKQDAEDSKNPHKKEKDEDKKDEVTKDKIDPITVDPKGQTPISGQAGSSIPCGAVADSAVATKNCTVPSGSADTATGTTPATGTGTTTGTTGSSTSTGSSSTGTGSSTSSGSSSSSSSSGSGSQSPAKGGTDK